MTSPLDHAATLVAWLAATDIDILELAGPDGHLRLRRGESGQGQLVDASACRPELQGGAGAQRAVVTSPGVGLLLCAHPLRDEPLVDAGDRVAAGQVLALLRIGAILVPVPAPCPGIVTAILAADGALVGFGDPVLELAALE